MKQYICALLLTVISAMASPHGAEELFVYYEQLRGMSYHFGGAQEDLLSIVKRCMKEQGDLFTVQSWFITDDQEVKVGMLDIALLSLKCQEKVLTVLITHNEQTSQYDQEFQEYEQEKLLADALRKAGVEQQLTDAEISHYADIMLGLWLATESYRIL